MRILISYHYHRKTDIAALVERAGGQLDIFADSGAYSAYAAGASISLADYAAWLKDWAALFTTAANLDVIGDHLSSRRNLERLEDLGLRPLPVFHPGEPWDVLADYAERYPYIALGGLVQHVNKHGAIMPWILKCFRMGRDHGTAFHGFGFTVSRLLRDLPFYSVDSASYTWAARYAMFMLWDEKGGGLRCCYFRRPQDVRRYGHLIRAHGLPLAEVSSPQFMRPNGPRSSDADRRAAISASAQAWVRMEPWLARRHRVPAPQGLCHPSPGTKVYLALSPGDEYILGTQAPARA